MKDLHKVRVEPLQRRSPLQRLDVMPFAVVDAALVAAWCLNYHVIGAMVAACCCHLFVFLMRNWSVDFDGYVGYRRSSQPNQETHVLVTPQQNKGNKMICKIYSASVKTSKGVDEEQFFSPKAKVCPPKRW